jgi:hypothetical protein
MPKKLDLERAAEYETVGALAVGHGHRRRSLASKGSVRLSQVEIQQVVETVRGVVGLIERVPQREIRARGGAFVRLGGARRKRALLFHF